MFDWIVNAIWEALRTVGGWCIDLFIWVLEWVFYYPGLFLSWLSGLAVDLVIEFLSMLAPYLPDGGMTAIVKAYVWLELIDEVFPLSFGISLLVAYYSIKLVLMIIKWTLKAIPCVWG